MRKRSLVQAMLAAPLVASFGSVQAQAAPFKIGFLAPMTGPFASTGFQMEAGVRLYMAQHGSTVAGRKIELIVKDDTGTPDVTKRLAQELVVNDKVDVLAGFGLTPGVPVSSLTMSSILRPATVLPCCAMYKRTPASIWKPVEANGPVIGARKPILKGAAWARAEPKVATNGAANMALTTLRFFILVSGRSFAL